MAEPTVIVSAEALRQVLQALIGPPHLIREIQFTRGLPGDDNPIDLLVREYNEQATGAKEGAHGIGITKYREEESHDAA